MSQQTSAASNTQRGGGLGTTIHPEGTSGQVLDQPTLVDRQLNAPVNPAYTTSFETVEAMLSRTWVYANTFSISTQMTPGQIIFARPIHPEFANQYNAHVVKMMNTWMGGYKIRIRIPATAFYGGSIRVAFLPPNNTLSSIRAMSLETLTVYPSRDLDPKNTDWIDFQMPDQRNIEFHYYLSWDEIQGFMTTDPKGVTTNWPTLIGGWFVCFVVAPLVAQSDSTQTVQMVLECSGSFIYRQPNPRFQLTDSSKPPPEQQGPLSSSTLSRLLFHAGCDSLYVGFDPCLTIRKRSTPTLTDGAFNCYGFNGKRPWEFPGQNFSEAAKLISAQFKEFSRPGHAGYVNTFMTRFVYNRIEVGDGKIYYAPEPPTEQSYTQTIALAGVNRSDIEYRHGFPEGLYLQCGPKKIVSLDAGNGLKIANILFQRNSSDPDQANYVTQLTTTISEEEISPYTGLGYIDSDVQIKPMFAGESVIIWQNNFPQIANMQPLQASVDLMNSKNLDENTSYLYSLRNTANPNVITRYIRLNPNGMFTTTGQDSDAMITSDADETSQWYLKFEQPLPLTDPIPSVSKAEEDRWKMFCKGQAKMLSAGKRVAVSKLNDWQYWSLLAPSRN